MALYSLFFDFKEDFPTFQDHIAISLLRSGLLLDEHDYQITAYFENYKLIQQSNSLKTTHGNLIISFIQQIVSIVIFRNVTKYVENHYKALCDDLLLCCRKQSILNVNVKRHFERRLTCLKILDIANALKETTLLHQEIKFLNDFCLLLTQINKSMMNTKESVTNDKMNNLDFKLFEVNCSQGCDLDECLEILKVTVDIFIYNTSEFLTALVLSFIQPFISDDSVTFYNLNVVLPNFLRSFKSSLQENEAYFEKTKYLLTVKDAFSTTELTNNKETKLISENLISRNISEILRNLQMSFEMVTHIHKNYYKNLDVSNTDFHPVKVCLEKSLKMISYIDTLSNKKDDDNILLPSAILSKESNKVIVLDNAEEHQVDEVFSCYTSDDTEVPLTKQYDDLFENYTSQKMLITELQEKLDLLTNLKGRKIAPDPGDQLLTIKEEPSKFVPEVLENKLDQLKDSSISRQPPIPPPPPLFNIFAENNTPYSFPKSLANQVKEIANKNKRDEEVFGSEYDSNETDDEI